MAGIWIQAQHENPAESPWSRVALQWDETYLLDPRGAAPALRDAAADVGAPPAQPPILLVSETPRDGEERWVLLAPPGAIFVNGLPLLTGIRLVRDLDEITVGGAHRFYLTYEDPARIVSFPGQERPIRCARCRRVIELGAPVVRCPNPRCRAWHHQDPLAELECWTHAPRCGACEQAAVLEGEGGWSPLAIAGES